MAAPIDVEAMKRKAVGLLKEQNRVRFSFSHFSADYSELTCFLVSRLLAAYRLNFLDSVTLTLLREAISNATKANLKRAYFTERKANIDDPESYARVLEDFKSEAVMKAKDYIMAMESQGLQVQIYFEMKPEAFRVVIENNVGIMPQEMSRIKSRLDLAARIESVADAFEEAGDEAEGAGIGLILNMLLLRRSGIGQNNFQIQSDGAKTRVSLTVPRNVQRPGAVQEISKKIADSVESVPTFPESVRRVINLCDDPKSGLPGIAREVERDPALSTSILRLANSGGFITGQRIDNIHKAVSIIGARNVRQLAVAHSSREILQSKFKVYQEFWEHAQLCAAYSRAIVEELGLRKHADLAYMGGLLHDIGKIILVSVEPDQVRAIHQIQMDRTDNSTAVLEEVAIGFSHAEVGAMLAERWSFSPALTAVIRHHHSAFAANGNAVVEASAVHIADAFLRAEEGRASYIYFDTDAQHRLGIESAAALESLHERVKARCAGLETQW